MKKIAFLFVFLALLVSVMNVYAANPYKTHQTKCTNTPTSWWNCDPCTDPSGEGTENCNAKCDGIKEWTDCGEIQEQCEISDCVL